MPIPVGIGPFLMAGRSSPEEAEEEGKSIFGRWKWLVLVAAIVVVIVALTQVSSFDCFFTSCSGGG